VLKRTLCETIAARIRFNPSRTPYMKTFLVTFEWQTNDAESNVWRNGWQIRAFSKDAAISFGEEKLFCRIRTKTTISYVI
jgi:hypothetical protein